MFSGIYFILFCAILHTVIKNIGDDEYFMSIFNYSKCVNQNYNIKMYQINVVLVAFLIFNKFVLKSYALIFTNLGTKIPFRNV